MSWRRFFRRQRADAELAQEIDLYLAEEIERKPRARHVCRRSEAAGPT